MDENDMQRGSQSDIDETDYSLESILSDYKREAFIKGERKLTSEELEEESERIVAELQAEEDVRDEKRPSDDVKEAADIQEHSEENSNKSDDGYTVAAKDVLQDKNRNQEKKLRKRNKEEKKYGRSVGYINNDDDPAVNIYSYDDLSEEEQEFFGIGNYARITSIHDEKDEVDAAVEKSEDRSRRRQRAKSFWNRLNDRFRAKEEEREQEDEEPELSVREAGAYYASGIGKLRSKSFAIILLSIIMVYFTFAGEIGVLLPSVFKKHEFILPIVMIVLEMLVLAFGFDIVKDGAAAILHMRANAESLVVLSLLATTLENIVSAVWSKSSIGTPCALLSALSLLFAMLGRAWKKEGIRNSYRTAISSSEPYSVIVADDIAEDEDLLVKEKTEISGFVSNSLEKEFLETVYSYAAPLLLVSAVLFSLITAVFEKNVYAFVRAFAMIAAVSAPFSALVAYGLPYSMLSRRLSAAGSAIAGWGGASEISKCDCIAITDADLFPIGTISLNGIRILSGANMDKVVAYTGSMISAADIGLKDIFAELMRSQMCAMLPVGGFTVYEAGGIGGTINGDGVLIGSSGFMNLMGIRVPANTNAKNAVFTAINDELVGIFAINYMAVNSVQNALVNLMNSKKMSVFAVKDFNISPALLEQKFMLPLNDIEFMSYEERYNLLADRDHSRKRTAAVVCREGLAPFTEVLLGAAQLVKTVRAGTVFSVASAVLGQLLLLYLFVSSGIESVTTMNLIVYMLTWIIPTFLIAGNSNRY